MPEYLFNQAEVKKKLAEFFINEKADISNFGGSVNQTFEAYVFANVIKWYQNNDWLVKIINPITYGKPTFKLKFNTRGAPKNYSYVYCTKGEKSCQIRHGLRIHTKYHRDNNNKSANIVCDIVIMKDVEIDDYSTDTALPNENLIAFGEVKHMSAYAELIASFIGLTFELKPDRLKRIRISNWNHQDNISCFLYVSGLLYPTAKGLAETIERRKYDIDIYSFDNPMND
ncbi:MAG: hypothetical protein ACOCUV_00105 [bacterium]